MARYAEGTHVPVEQSKAEIERMLKKAGADQFGSAWSATRANFTFRLNGKYIRVELPIPVKDESTRWNTDARVAAETRRRYRALGIYLKAMLEAVESEIVAFETAFMPHVLMPNQETVATMMVGHIEQAYASGKMPKQLPGW